MLLWFAFAILMVCGLFFSLRLRNNALEKIAEESEKDVSGTDD